MKKILNILIIILMIPSLCFATNAVFYSLSPYGTGDIKTGSPTIEISSGIATLSVAQTGNIGVGCCIDYDPNNNILVYIAPNRLGFDSGGTTELKINTKIEGGTSGATGIVRAIEITGGSWAGGDAAGWIYFSISRGTWQDDEQINRIKPSTSNNIATANGILEGNIGSGNTQFIVKYPTGIDANNVVSAQIINSIHHEYASLSAFEASFIDANHINDSDLTNINVIAHACCYYDHDDQTADTTTTTINFGTTGVGNYLQVYTPIGNCESINNQRHSGYLDNNKYKLATTATCITAAENYINIFGLQIAVTASSGGPSCIYFSNLSGSTSFYVADNIMIGSYSGAAYAGYGIYVLNSVAVLYVWNNIAYDIIFGADTDFSGIYSSSSTAIYYYNNTQYNCYHGVKRNSGTMVIKNNLCNDCTDCYTGTLDATSEYNITNSSSDDGAFSATHATGTTTSTVTNKLNDSGGGLSSAKINSIVKNSSDPNNITYSYVTIVDSDTQLTLNDDLFADPNFGEDYTVYKNIYGVVAFKNESGDDFHLSGSDTVATGKGNDLSLDVNLNIWNDIDGDERSPGWGIGADDASVDGYGVIIRIN